MPLNENAINEILPFATDGSVIEGDLMSLDEYIASNLRRKGHQTGVALRSVFNRQARQTSHITAGVAQFIANQYPDGVVDDGDIDKVEAGLTAAIKKITKDPDIRKWPVDEPVYATPGQVDITPGFELDTVRDNVALFIDGLRQARGTYTYTDTTITTKEPLVGGESLEVFSADITPSSVAPLYTVNNLSDVPDKAVAKNNLGISESPVGTIVPVLAADGYTPNGCLPCDANEYSRASFTEFYDNYLAPGKLLTCTYGEYATQVALTGNCAKFAIDTVGRTFKTPLIKDGDSITQAASIAEMGKSVKAGLPNITGSHSGIVGGSTSGGSGAITLQGGGRFQLTTQAGQDHQWWNESFDASKSNSIYGNSTTVTDEQIRLRHFVVVASSQLNNSAFNWSNYLAALAGKANIDLSNVDETGKLTAAVSKYEIGEFYYFRHPTLKTGFQPAQGGVIANAATVFPEIWAYLQTTEGQKLCKTEAEWQAMSTAIWATLADGTTVGWNGIGGVPYYAPNLGAGSLRMPDVRGMYPEAAGFDALGVGGVHGDAIRQISGNITGQLFWAYWNSGGDTSSAMYISNGANANVSTAGGSGFRVDLTFSASRRVPTATKNQPRAWGALACCYLGQPA